MRRLYPLAFLFLGTAAFAQDPILGPQFRVSIDPISKSASETTGAATKDGMEIVAGFVDFRPGNVFRNAFALTSNGGQSWAHVVLRPPVGFEANTEADPMTAYDPRTNTLFAGGISAAKCIYVARKTPGQNTFGPAMIARIADWPDKGWMAAGPRPGLPNSTRLYITYNEGIIWSDDLGASWVPPVGLGQGYGFLPRVGAQGELFLTYWDGFWGIKFTKSLDGGQTWSTVVQPGTRLASWGVESYGIPGTFRNFTNNTMAVNPVNGDIVIVWVDQTNIVNNQKNLDLYMSKSSDQGATWTDATRLPFRPLNQVSDMIFPWVEFTKDGRLHLFSMDTSYDPGQIDGVPHGLWDQVYFYSDDSGSTWSPRMRLTPVSWDSFFDGNGYNFLGDYQGMAASDKSVFPIYPDTRLGESEAHGNKIFNPIEWPTSFELSSGSLISPPNLSALFWKDSLALIAKPLNQSGRTTPIQFEMTSEGLPSSAPASLSVSVTSSAGPGSLEQEIHMFDAVTSAWDLVDRRPLTQIDSTATIALSNPSRYILPATRTARWRVIFKPFTRQALSGTASINQAVLLMDP